MPPGLQDKGEPLVKGDSKSYIIGAASIIAKARPADDASLSRSAFTGALCAPAHGRFRALATEMQL